MIQLLNDKTFDFLYCQENEQYNNKKGILRGLHYQAYPYAQVKCCHVIKGKVLSVAVDIRVNSKNFGKYTAYELDDVLKQRMLIPKGFAHGYITLSDESILIYQVNEYFNLSAMRGLAFDDKDLNIDWKIPNDKVIVSFRDKNNLALRNLERYREEINDEE